MSGEHYESMWLQAVELLEQAERLQRRFVRYLGPGKDVVAWEPPVDIHESGEGLRLAFALPGVAPEDVEIRLENEALIVSAVRRLSCPAAGGVLRRLEIPHGRFLRRIALSRPSMIADSRYRNGCLELRLVPAERAE
jgi:HSP20 family molecular chaperone IbpA